MKALFSKILFSRCPVHIATYTVKTKSAGSYETSDFFQLHTKLHRKLHCKVTVHVVEKYECVSEGYISVPTCK